MFVHPEVLRGLRDQGYAHPTPIQRAVLPAAIRGRSDVVGAAETGSGKTLAFAIPILNGILNSKEKNDDEIEEETNEENVAAEEDGKEEAVDNSDEEDFSDQEMETGCVKVVNDVEIDFEPEILVADGNEPDDNISEAPAAAAPPPRPKSNRRLYALILTPTRELAIQIKDHIEAAAKHTGIRTAVVVGGMAAQKQRRLLARQPEIVVGTPGRLWDLISEGDLHLAKVKQVRYLAIDETDRMVEKGHFEEMQQLLEMINESGNEGHKAKRQTFVFSATLSMVHELPAYLMKKKKVKSLTPREKLAEITSVIGVKAKPKVVDLTRKVATAETLIESKMHCSITEKDFYLYYLFTQHPGRTLVFCNSIDCVRRLVNLFGYLKCGPLGLHAQMQQRQRLKNLDRFTKNPKAILIATDVAARGLDIKDIQHVIHYQVPRTSENYVHRSGRTARATKEGISVMMIEPAENASYKKLCKTLGRTAGGKDDLPTFPVDSDVFPQVKLRVQVARELDKLLLSSKKEQVEKSWFKKAAEEMEIEFSGNEDEEDDDDERVRLQRHKETTKRKNDIQSKQFELSRLLALPITQSGFSGKYPTMSGRLAMPKLLAENAAKSAIDRLTEEVRESKKVLKSRPSKASVKNHIRSKHRKKKANKKSSNAAASSE